MISNDIITHGPFFNLYSYYIITIICFILLGGIKIDLVELK